MNLKSCKKNREIERFPLAKQEKCTSMNESSSVDHVFSLLNTAGDGTINTIFWRDLANNSYFTGKFIRILQNPWNTQISSHLCTSLKYLISGRGSFEVF